MDKPITEIKEYQIPQKQILKVMGRKKRIGVTSLSITLGVVFLLVIISSAVQGDLDDYFPYIASGFIIAAVIISVVLICINIKWKRIGKNIPEIVSVSGECLYIETEKDERKNYMFTEIKNLTMTPLRGGTDGFRRIIINCHDTQDIYCFGFISDEEKIFPRYSEMFLDLQDMLKEKFIYETV